MKLEVKKKWIVSKGYQTLLTTRNLSENMRELKDLKISIRDLQKEIKILKSFAILHETKQQSKYNNPSASNQWIKRELNVIQHDGGVDVKLDSGAFILQEGSYRLRASIPTYAANYFRTRIASSDGIELLLGTGGYCAHTLGVNSFSFIDGVIKLTQATKLHLEHRVTHAASAGFGHYSGIGTTETYSMVEIHRVG